MSSEYTTFLAGNHQICVYIYASGRPYMYCIATVVGWTWRRNTAQTLTHTSTTHSHTLAQTLTHTSTTHTYSHCRQTVHCLYMTPAQASCRYARRWYARCVYVCICMCTCVHVCIRVYVYLRADRMRPLTIRLSCHPPESTSRNISICSCFSFASWDAVGGGSIAKEIKEWRNNRENR